VDATLRRSNTLRESGHARSAAKCQKLRLRFVIRQHARDVRYGARKLYCPELHGSQAENSRPLLAFPNPAGDLAFGYPAAKADAGNVGPLLKTWKAAQSPPRIQHRAALGQQVDDPFNRTQI
jgi:hypothetical protein